MSSVPAAVDDERVVLVDEDGVARGTAPKRSVHHAATPLHLAFSCYVFDRRGALLVTRRSHRKQTWPGVWTNSLCGHPGPTEPVEAAVRRRAADELGIALHDLRLALPDFRYRAVMDTGVVEHELCPVFTALTDDPPAPAPDEVGAFAWQDWQAFSTDVLAGVRSVSPWCVEQVRLLDAAGRHPRELDRPRQELPPAARLLPR